MWALITGASSGIGKDMAIYLSSKGYDLVLTSSPKSKEALNSLKDTLNTNVKTFSIDLSNQEAPFKLYEFCKGLDIHILINSAGFGVFGAFDKTSLDRELSMINVNIVALHVLTKLFLKDFKSKNRGYILNVSSSAGFMTGPLLSSYYASKNYVLRLSLAINEELRRERSNVKISVLCPGPVDTNFNSTAGVSFSVKPLSSEYVSHYAIDSMFKGKCIIVPSFTMKLGIFATRFVPYSVLAKVTYSIQKAKLSQ